MFKKYEIPKDGMYITQNKYKNIPGYSGSFSVFMFKNGIAEEYHIGFTDDGTFVDIEHNDYNNSSNKKLKFLNQELFDGKDDIDKRAIIAQVIDAQWVTV